MITTKRNTAGATMNNWILAVMAFFMVLSAHAKSKNDSICGRVVLASKKAQLIPPQGKKVQTRIDQDYLVDCGSMVMTNEDPVWIEMTDLTRVRIADHTFFEFGQAGVQKHQLYRGRVLITAPQTIQGFELFTPNSITEFKGGVALIDYDSKEKETAVSSFNRKVVFKNKFHPDADQSIAAGEMSRLWISESRIVPTEPEIMDSKTVKPAVAPFKISAEEVVELTAVVERAVEARSKSFVADLESWEDIEEESQRAAERNLASYSAKTKTEENAIDEKEAQRAIELLKDRLYGAEEDWKIHDESRKPASATMNAALKDPEYERKKALEKKQIDETLEAIKNLQ
jgi:hypothetical protein